MRDGREANGGADGLAGRLVLVAGGSGNVGRHIVAALLDRGASVVVPSRYAAKLEALRAESARAAERLVTVAGDVGDEEGAARVRDEVERRFGRSPGAVIAALGRWAPAESLVGVGRRELLATLEDYVVAHFVVARTFLPVLEGPDASYTLVNGPSAFSVWPGSALVSIATAAQSMLARALASEAGADPTVRVAELVIHPSSYIGPGAATSDGPIDGPAVGRYAAAVVAGEVTGGPSLHLQHAEQLAALAQRDS